MEEGEEEGGGGTGGGGGGAMLGMESINMPRINMS